ncbi:MAG: alpha-amylase family glycosyl hydrolase [Bacteroidota bacterium]
MYRNLTMFNPKAHTLLKEVINDLPIEIKQDQDFVFRLAANFSGLYHRFHRLYGSTPSFEEALKPLISVLATHYGNRSDDLKLKDLQRQDGQWLLSNQVTGMVIDVDRFCDDLPGLLTKMDYLEDFGVNLLHLLPFTECGQEKNDGDYTVSDHFSIDKRFGTQNDFHKVIREIHDREMYVMCDLVVNHTSEAHEWAQCAKKGDQKYQDYFYTFSDRTVADLFERSLPDIYPESAPGNFTFSEEMDKWVMTVFNDYQWDLNYSNPQVLIEMINILLVQANWGIDIFRLDAVAFIWKKLGTASQNLPEVHVILQIYKACCQIVAPGIALFAETTGAPEEIIKYFGTRQIAGNECDMVSHTTFTALLWDGIATHNCKILNSGLQALPQKVPGTTWVNRLRDQSGFDPGYSDEDIRRAGYDPHEHRKFIVSFFTGKFGGTFSTGMPFRYNPKHGNVQISGALASLAGLEKAREEGDIDKIDLAIKRILLLHAMILSYGGIPMLYYGDETGTENDYSFLQDEKTAYDSRWLHKPKINWAKRHKELKDERTPSAIIFSDLKHMIKIRKSSPEWADYTTFRKLETGNDYLLAFERRLEDKVTLTIANFKDAEQWLPVDWVAQNRLNVDNLFDKYSAEPIMSISGAITLSPYQFMWLTEVN